MAAKDDGGATAPQPFFNVGEIRSSKESDFDYFLHLCDNDEGWELKQGGPISIWNRDMGKTGVKMLKVKRGHVLLKGRTPQIMCFKYMASYKLSLYALSG